MNDQITVSGNPRGWPTGRILKALIQAMRAQRLFSRRPLVLNVSIVAVPEMTRLNFKFRGKRRSTDVLSFEQPENPGPFFFLGDLVLCEGVLRQQAKDRGHGVSEELAVLLCHGLLHLLGYDHEKSEVEHRRMARFEQKILKAAKLKGVGSETAGLIGRARVEKSHYGRHRKPLRD